MNNETSIHTPKNQSCMSASELASMLNGLNFKNNAIPDELVGLARNNWLVIMYPAYPFVFYLRGDMLNGEGRPSGIEKAQISYDIGETFVGADKTSNVKFRGSVCFTRSNFDIATIKGNKACFGIKTDLPHSTFRFTKYPNEEYEGIVYKNIYLIDMCEAQPPKEKLWKWILKKIFVTGLPYLFKALIKK